MDPNAEVELGVQPMDCTFHTTREALLAVGLVDGNLRLVDCAAAQPTEVTSIAAHRDSCRAVIFASSEVLLSGSADRTLAWHDLERHTLIGRVSDAHEALVTRLQAIDAKIAVSGDDDGVLKTWDQRQRKAAQEFKHHTDYISDLAYQPSRGCLLATSGDGSLSVVDPRKPKALAQSDGDPDDSLESLAVVKGGRQVVCGSISGDINVYKWGDWDAGGKFTGHPAAVDAMVKLDEDSVITGCSDGVLRVLSVLPNRLAGVLGADPDGECGRLALSRGGRWLAAAGCSTAVRLWDLEADGEGEAAAGTVASADAHLQPEDAEGPDSEPEQRRRQKRPKKKRKKSAATEQHAAFFTDLD